MTRAALLIAVLLVTIGCDQPPQSPAPSPDVVVERDPLAGVDVASLTPQELDDRIEAFRAAEAYRSEVERRQAVSVTRRAITRDLRWIGGALLLVGAGLAIASAFVTLIPTRAAWTALAVSGVVYGGSWVMASLAPLEPFMPWVAGISLLVSGGAVAWVAYGWISRKGWLKSAGKLMDKDEARAAVAIRAEVLGLGREARKAELTEAIEAEGRGDRMGAVA